MDAFSQFIENNFKLLFWSAVGVLVAVFVVRLIWQNINGTWKQNKR